MSIRTKAILAIIIASLLWATNVVVAKSLLINFDPLFIALVRSSIASLFMIPIVLREKRYPIKLMLKDVVPVTSLSAINIALYYSGLHKTTVNASAIIYAATPLVVVIISIFTIHEHISLQKIIGIIIGFIGVLSFILLPSIGRGDVGFGTPVGNGILLIAVVAWASFIVGSRYLTNIKHYTPLFVTSLSIFSSAVMLFFVYLMVPHRINITVLFTPQVIVSFLYISFFVTVVTYVLFQWAIHKLSSSTASLTNYLQPMFAFYFAWLFLGERITPAFLFGSLLVLLGVFIASANKLTTIARTLREGFF